jgi:soluble lytic murein transglycosylase-like protein
MVLKQIQSAMVAAALAACGLVYAHAAERVSLTNGFAMECNHHALVDGQMRLYVGAGEASYIALKPDEITGVETVPDPPAALATASPSMRPERAAVLNPADLHEMLSQAGQAHNLDVDLLASVVKAESNGNARAVSRAGAQGLMQLMPSTAGDLGVQDSFEPGQNVRGGSAYLDALLTRYHDNLALALAAYNAGPAAVDKYHGIPPYRETRVYVARVMHEFNRRVQARQAPQVTSKTTALSR